MYGYFNNSLKIHLEFQGLAQTLETKGNKIFKNVKTRWMSTLEPLKDHARKLHFAKNDASWLHYNLSAKDK
jgi:hypothetical protein